MNRIKEILSSDPYSEKENMLLKALIQKRYDDELRSELSHELQQKHNIPPSKPYKGNVIKRIFMIGAIAASLILGWIILNPVIAVDNIDKRAIAMLEADQALHPGLNKGSTVETLRIEAIQAFNNREYEKAITMFNSIKPATEEDQFYNALSQLKSHNYEKASADFELLIDNEIYGQEAKWYYILSLVLDGQYEKAKIMIDQIKEGEYMYQNTRELRSLIH